MHLFLNELSVPSGGIDLDEAKRTFKSFVATVQAIRKLAPDMAFYAHDHVRNLSIGDAHPIASLRNMPDCREESQFLARLQDLAPMSLSLLASEISSEGVFEYLYLNRAAGASSCVEARGLGFAHFFDGACVSFDHVPAWKAEAVELLYRSIDLALNIVDAPVSARNLSDKQHVQNRAEWLKTFNIPDEVAESSVADGEELWARRAELFPNLDFIPRTESQIKGLMAGQHLFLQVYAQLSKLNAAIEAWTPADQNAPPYGFQDRPESRSRIQDGVVSFNDADGKTRVFSLHVYVAPPPHRIHWLVETIPKKTALVGHVGRKIGIG